MNKIIFLLLLKAPVVIAIAGGGGGAAGGGPKHEEAQQKEREAQQKEQELKFKASMTVDWNMTFYNGYDCKGEPVAVQFNSTAIGSGLCVNGFDYYEDDWSMKDGKATKCAADGAFERYRYNTGYDCIGDRGTSVVVELGIEPNVCLYHKAWIPAGKSVRLACTSGTTATTLTSSGITMILLLFTVLSV